MAAQAGSCGISVFPEEVLSKVLQRVSLQDRFSSCSLVCSLWRKAAAMSINTVELPRCDDTKATSLSAWLQAHAARAPLHSITVAGYPNKPDLILPVQHLAALQTLRLVRVQVSIDADAQVQVQADAAADAEAGAEAELDAALAILTPALSGLTRLDLLSCTVWLKGLHGLTGLQHLEVRVPPAAAAAGLGGAHNLVLLFQAVPQLTHLTALHLSGGAAHNKALVHLSKLACLQELQLTDASDRITEASFQVLPPSLTRLDFEIDDRLVLEGEAGPDFHFSPSSTPGLCELTALQELNTRGGSSRRCFFHVGTLTALLALRKLTLTSCKLTANEERTLSVLTALTQLEHLQLSFFNDGALVSPADYAAITSSQQLTYLDLKSCVSPEHAADVFPDNLLLPNMRSLNVDIRWCEETEPIERLVNCCPNIRDLSILSYGGNDIADIEPGRWVDSLGCLTGLGDLTRLSFMALDVAMTTDVYRAIAALTGLQELRLDTLDANQLGPAVELAGCRQLTKLDIQILAMEAEGNLSVHATNKAPAGSPPDVWRQIPALILQAAADYLDVNGPKFTPLLSLLRAAALVSSSASQREGELEERVEVLEQRVAGLQGTLEAVLQHLQLPGPAGGGHA